MAINYNEADYQTTPTLETFGFLPKLTPEEIQMQVAYIIANGWTPAIEHEHPSQASDHYWTMWKLPLFGETDIGRVLDELDTCGRTYPDHHIRLIGYDSYTQSQGSAFVVREGRA
ncbi:ribulose bisphosphate carboxylase small subunit [Sulfuriflexus mobilis]|uniref:ribulose bisphosphate carboxylase small subunit n=1 Tax=Sulfuriflexus mobilis TaxID=1811807 RepID=UPI000F83937F|nr:ribulose bisphosphate carboxylase small subunit [Sulfuriflexus mobilis]